MQGTTTGTEYLAMIFQCYLSGKVDFVDTSLFIPATQWWPSIPKFGAVPVAQLTRDRYGLF